MEAICSYQSTDPSIASFHAGDLALRVKDSTSGWLCVKLKGNTAWVPGQYWRPKEGSKPQLPTRPPDGPETSPHHPPLKEHHRAGPWFMGIMSRVDCEDFLLERGEDRGFVVRASTNRVGNYTLSVRYGDRVRHFPIILTQEGKYYIGKHNFKDLNKVVAYYQGNPLFYDDNDQSVSLGNPVVMETSC